MSRSFAALTGSFGAGLAIGWVCWGESQQLWMLIFALLLPICWALCVSRPQIFVLSLGYFMAGARGLPAGAVAFFGPDAPQWWGVVMWFSASVLWSIPFALFWSHAKYRRAWGFLAALLATSIPPIGIVGWISPLSVAGVLFPGSAWYGLIGCLAIFFFLVQGQYMALIPAFALALGLNFAAKDFERKHPPTWEAANTQFSNMWSAGTGYASQRLASMERTQWLVNRIEQLPAGSVLVLPETLLGRWDGIIEAMLADAERSLAAKGSRVLVGAEMDNRQGGYQNVLVVLGAQEGESRLAIQSLPVPISMWKPWASDGAEADFMGRGNTITVGNQRVGVSICYEQLVIFSVLRLMLDRPDLIAAVSNVWWARATNIPDIQEQSISAFARLFNIPVISARNT